MKYTLFTIGHSTHTLKSFIELLNKHSVREIGDVRSQPYSKYSRMFNRENIEQELNKNDIVYSFMGHELGGRISHPDCYDNKGKLQYRQVARLSGFQSALNRIRNKLETHNMALMCSEKDPLQCHRMILVCRELSYKTGFSEEKIKHIFADGSVRTNQEMEKALMDKFRLYPDMFRTEKECVEEAYDRQAQKIAYTYKESSYAVRGIQPDLSGVVFDERGDTHPL